MTHQQRLNNKEILDFLDKIDNNELSSEESSDDSDYSDHLSVASNESDMEDGAEIVNINLEENDVEENNCDIYDFVEDLPNIPLPSRSQRVQNREATASSRPSNDSSTPATPRTTILTSRTTPVTQRATTVTSRATLVTQRATQVTQRATPVTSRATPVTSRATPVTSRATPVTSRATPVTQRATPETSRNTLRMTARDGPMQSRDSSTLAQDDDEENSRTFVGKNGTVWDKEPANIGGQGRARSCNLYRPRRGRKFGPNIPDTIPITNPVQAMLIFLKPIIPLIVLYTNMEAERVFAAKKYKYDWVPCDAIEIYSFIGITMLAGVLRQSKHTYELLWNARYGPPIFRACFALRRFKQLLRYMRFDDKINRNKDDKFAPFREVWDIVNELFGKYYEPGPHLTVDEQLVAFRGRCGFRQYMPNKPAKYGLKIFYICDADNAYPVGAIPYHGKVNNQIAAPGLGSRIVETLAQPFYGTGRNITCDNYFTDLELARNLLSNGLTLVGTVRKNKAFLPLEFKPDRKRAIESSLFGFQNDTTIVSYVPALSKCVILLSTMHHDEVVDVETRKPEIILYYNSTKGGVDTLDQLVNTYPSKRSTERWPMAYFYNLIDVMGVAAFVIWNAIYPHWNKDRKFKRRLFLMEVAEDLMILQLRRRAEQCNDNTRRNIRQVLGTLGDPLEEVVQEPAPNQRNRGIKRCHFCPRKEDKKSRSCCTTCNKFVCQQHSVVKRLCITCNEHD